MIERESPKGIPLQTTTSEEAARGFGDRYFRVQRWLDGEDTLRTYWDYLNDVQECVNGAARPN